jgi:hypothetical protein
MRVPTGRVYSRARRVQGQAFGARKGARSLERVCARLYTDVWSGRKDAPRGSNQRMDPCNEFQTVTDSPALRIEETERLPRLHHTIKCNQQLTGDGDDGDFGLAGAFFDRQIGGPEVWHPADR